eukprot:PhF_6_TR28083/c0_g1_i4/m.41497
MSSEDFAGQQDSFTCSSFVDIRPPIDSDRALQNAPGTTSQPSASNNISNNNVSSVPQADLSQIYNAVRKKREFVQTINREVFVRDLLTSFPKAKFETTEGVWKALWEQFSIDLPRQKLIIAGKQHLANPVAALAALESTVTHYHDTREKKKIQEAERRRNQQTQSPVGYAVSCVSSFLWKAKQDVVDGVTNAAPSIVPQEDRPSPLEFPPAKNIQELLLFCQQSVLALAYQMLRSEYSNVFLDVHLVSSTSKDDKMVVTVQGYPEGSLKVEKTFHLVRIDAQTGDTINIGSLLFTMLVDLLVDENNGCVLTTWKFA